MRYRSVPTHTHPVSTLTNRLPCPTDRFIRFLVGIRATTAVLIVDYNNTLVRDTDAAETTSYVSATIELRTTDVYSSPSSLLDAGKLAINTIQFCAFHNFSIAI